MDPVKRVKDLFLTHRDSELAVPMAKYMKDKFPFLGIKKPVREELLKQFYRESGILKEPFQEDFVLALWEQAEREYQYVALDYIKRSLKKIAKHDLPLMERLITTKSWWDTVDMLAQHPVGTIARKYPEVVPETIVGWAAGEQLWLRRAAILFQLKYKEKTDEQLLFQIIKWNAKSSEFFIQKAIGWALREYSKTSPAAVRQFIARNELPPLSVREGNKYLGHA